jgi:hypothetical protein
MRLSRRRGPCRCGAELPFQRGGPAILNQRRQRTTGSRANPTMVASTVGQLRTAQVRIPRATGLSLSAHQLPSSILRQIAHRPMDECAWLTLRQPFERFGGPRFASRSSFGVLMTTGRRTDRPGRCPTQSATSRPAAYAGRQFCAAPIVSAMTAPRRPRGLSGPTVESFEV